MARASSVISVAITGDSRKLQGAVRGADKSVQGFGGSMKKAAAGIGAALAGLFVVDKAFEFLGDSLGEADRLGDSVSNLNRIIGRVNTKKIQEAADDFLDLGLSSADVLELSVGFARIARAIGIKPKLIADYADDVSAVAQALSLVDEKGRPAAKWIEIIAKAASKPNNTRMLQALGITVSEAKVIKRALEDTGKASKDLLKPGEISAARFLIIMEKLKGVVPEALMNPDVELKQEQLKARIEELQGKIGQGLQPIVADLLTSLLDISKSEWVGSMMQGVDKVRAAIPGLVTDFTEGFDLVNATISEDMQEILDFIKPVTDLIGEVPDLVGEIPGAVDALAKDFGKAFGQMYKDVQNVLGPLATLLQFARDAAAELRGLNGPTRSGNFLPKTSDRSISDAQRRQQERNGLGT